MRYGSPVRLLPLLLLLPACAAPAPEQLPQPPPNVRLAPAEPQPERVDAVPVHGLSILRLTVNQAAQVEVMSGFEAVEPSAPLVPGKAALIRAHLAPHLDWEPRAVRGILTVHAADRSFVSEEVIQVDGPSFDGDLETTLDAVVPGEFVQPGLSVEARIVELDGVERDASPGRTTWPLDGAQALPFAPWGGTVRVRLLPVVYAADGSDRRPDTSDEQVALIHDTLVAMYPTAGIELTIDDELVWPEPIGSTWGLQGLLDAVVDEREARAIPADHYLYALVAPAESRLSFCAAGCTAGLSYRPDNPNRAWMRSSVSLGYSGVRTAETMAHELGHAHGRRHAPCGGATQADPDFPYAGGLLGTWGWDGEQLHPPGSTGDVMGYCDPKWVSDYQVAALHARIVAVAGLFGDEERGAEEARWFAEGPDGALVDRGVRRRVLDSGEPIPVTMLVGGHEVAGVARWHPLDDQPGGAWLLPDPAATAFWP
jgi:hypothetical protein